VAPTGTLGQWLVALRFADIDVVAAITECGVFDFKIHREALNLTEDSWADYIRGSNARNLH
jgi:hypothetical protein